MKISWLKEGLVYGLSGTLSRFMGFFLAPIYTRFLTTEEYGVLDLGTTLFAIMLILAESQMIAGFMRSYYEVKEKNNLGRLGGSILAYYVLTNVIMIVAAWTTVDHLAAVLPGLSKSLLLPLLVGLFPQQIISLGLTTLRLEGKIWKFSMISVGQILLAGIAGIIAVVPMKAGAVGILWAIALSRVVFTLPAILVIVRMLHFRPSTHYIREMATFGIPIMPAVLSNWVQVQMNRFFVTGMLSLAALGVFSIATKIAAITLLFTISFRQVWEPRAVRLYGQAGSEPIFVRIAEAYAFLMFGVLVGVTTLSPIILRIIAPEPYWGAAPFISILSAGYILSEWAVILSSGNNWARKTYYNTYGNLIAAAVSIALLWWGTRAYGLFLVTLTFVIASSIKSTLVLYTSQSNHYMPFSKVSIATAIIGHSVYVLFAYYLLQHSDLSLPVLMVTLLASGAALLGGMWLLVLRTDSRNWLFRLVRPYNHARETSEN